MSKYVSKAKHRLILCVYRFADLLGIKRPTMIKREVEPLVLGYAVECNCVQHSRPVAPAHGVPSSRAAGSKRATALWLNRHRVASFGIEVGEVLWGKAHRIAVEAIAADLLEQTVNYPGVAVGSGHQWNLARIRGGAVALSAFGLRAGAAAAGCSATAACSASIPSVSNAKHRLYDASIDLLICLASSGRR